MQITGVGFVKGIHCHLLSESHVLMVCSKNLRKSNLVSRVELVAEFNLLIEGQEDKVASLEADN